MVRAVNNNAPFLVDDEGGSRALHRFDHHAAVALAADFSNHTIVIKGGWTNKTNQLVFDADIDATGGHLTLPPCWWNRLMLMKSPPLTG